MHTYTYTHTHTITHHHTQMMSANIEDAAALYQQLEAAWNERDLSSVSKLLPQLKIQLLNLSFLPTGGRGNDLDTRELVLARNTLEIGALWSIEKRDIPSFQRYFAQLKCYYFDFGSLLPESPYKFNILGLNLLSLLAQNRLAEFHTELELLPVDELRNVYIKHPISLEQFLMEGSFHKVFLSKGNVPAENYNFFIDILIGTIRDEIASCAEKAYTQLSVTEATKMLMCESPQELEAYVEERGWVCEGEFFLFAQEEKKEELHFVRNSLLISQALGYARELEKIV